MGATLIIAALAGVCALVEIDTLSLPHRDIRVADVAHLDCIGSAEARARVGALSIARLAPGGRVQLTRRALAHLVARRAPALASLQAGDSARVIALSTVASPPRHNSRSCYQVAAPLSAGQLVSQQDVTQTACATEDETGALVFDRVNGLPRAREALDAGHYLGRVSLPAGEVHDAGDQLALRVQSGPVVIERPVTALQPSREGERVFVRDMDGAIFTAPASTQTAATP